MALAMLIQILKGNSAWFSEHLRFFQDAYDFSDKWSEWWGDMTWPIDQQ